MSIVDRLKLAFEGFSTPLLPDDYTRMVNPLWSARELRGRIVRVNRPTDDTAELVIRRGWGVPADFKAGQYIGLGVRMDGRFIWRSYSLTSVPKSKDGYLTVTVKEHKDGRLSRHLVENVKEGTVVRLAAPAGDFHLTDPIPSELMFVTAGSGVTPVISMLRDLRSRTNGDAPDVVHVHSVRSREDLLFAEELEAMQATYPWYSFELRVTSEQGRLNADTLREIVPDADQRTVYACGPSAMLDEIEEAFTDVRTERFTIDRGATQAEGGVITFPGRGSVEVDGATTILEAGEQIDIQLPYGCRMGICATCTQQLAAGTARDLRTGTTHVEGERIRTCVCVAAGDIELEP